MNDGEIMMCRSLSVLECKIIDLFIADEVFSCSMIQCHGSMHECFHCFVEISFYSYGIILLILEIGNLILSY